MACFTVPVAEAIVTTAITKIVKSKEKAGKSSSKGEVMKVKFSEKLSWLNKMLLGGSALLAFEHRNGNRGCRNVCTGNAGMGRNGSNIICS